MTIRFDNLFYIPADYKSSISVGIEGPLQPYNFQWDLAKDSQVGKLTDYITVNIIPGETWLGE